MRPLCKCLGIAVCAFIFAMARAETPEPAQAPDVIVTATRFEEPYADKATNVTVITARQIEQSPATTIPELLAHEAGITMRDFYGNNATHANVDLRGFGVNSPQNTLILLDGRRLDEIELSNVQWSAIPLPAIERIEIVRGSGSVLYGAGAGSGVINIITKSPAASVSGGTLAARAGDLGTQEVQGSANLAGDRVGLFASGAYYHSDGYRENNRTEDANAYADLRWKDERTTLSLKANADRQHVRLPGGRLVDPSIGLDEVTTDRRGTSTPLDFTIRTDYRTAFELAHGFERFDFNVGLAYRDKDQTSYFAQGGFPDYREVGLGVWSLTPRVRIPLAGIGHDTAVVVGFDWYRWDYDRRVSNAVETIGQPSHHVTAEQDNQAAYMQLNSEITQSTSVIAGWRRERQSIDANDAFDPSAPSNFPDSAAPPGSQVLTEEAWEVGLRQKLTTEMAAFARAGRSFRFANVDELYEFTPAFERDFQFLRPQTAISYEIGLERRATTSFARLTLFQIDTEDEIHLDPFTNGVGNTNFPPSRRQGVELEVTWQASPDLTVGANYTYMHARFQEGVLPGDTFTAVNVQLAGKTVPLVPTHHVNLQAAWNIRPQLLLSANVEFVSSQFMENDEANTSGVKIPVYSVTDLKLVYSPGRWRLSAAVNNLFNEEYFNYAVASTSTVGRYNAYPLPERTFWLGAQYSFN
jgi:iron complex outermembrane recepter protein